MNLLRKENPFKVLCLRFVDESRVLLQDVEEYACGYAYFYVRHQDGQTESFPRTALAVVERRVRDGSFHPIHLKKAKLTEKGYEFNNGDAEAL